MSAGKWKKIAGLATGGGALGIYLTLSRHDYDLNALGFLRLGRAALTVFNVGLYYKQELINSKLDRTSQDFAELKSKVHTEAAKKLLDLCCANGGVYIKVGQHIAALDYLVPHEYVEVMKVLHSDAPRSNLKGLLRVLEEDLKHDPYEIFDCFDEEPLGSASLAQVHKATLKDGTVVAVKIQHPLVLRNSRVDMKTMEVLVSITSKVFKDFDYQWLVDETKKNLPKELNFKLEAENAEKVQKLLKGFKWLKIPKIYWNLTTERVLTMEFVEGTQVTDLDYINDSKVNRFDLSSKLGELYSHMIFKHGFVHSDPHPGNILIHKNKNKDLDIVLLDHGLYADLTEEFRWNYSKFWLSILNKDFEGMKTHSEKLGIGKLYPILVCMVTGRTWDVVNEGIDKVKYSSEEKEKFNEKVPELLNKIGEVLASVNRQMLLILKTNDLLRGIEHSLKVEQRQPSFLVMTKCCIDNLYEEKLRVCKNALDKFYVHVWKHWAVFKLNIYYIYLNVRSKVSLQQS